MKRIPAFRLHPEPLTEEAANLQKFEWNKDYVYRHKLGGEPEFIQSEDWPACSDCGQKMTFYAQLDSINDEFVISDCGMIYAFACLECVTVEAVVQSF